MILSRCQFNISAEFSVNEKTDGLLNTWRLSNSQVALKCDTWCGSIQGYDEEPEQSGMRLSASLSLLKRLCKKYNADLIIGVNLSREFKYRPEDHEYSTPSHKIYIFTEDGRLKSTEQNINLR